SAQRRTRQMALPASPRHDRRPATAHLADRYRAVRALTEQLRAPLSAEDCQVQSMHAASPTKWHLPHTSWFLETFVLAPTHPDDRPFHTAFRELFNSYSQRVGAPHPRPQRGLLTRPSLDEVLAYRAHVDHHVLELLTDANGNCDASTAAVLEIGVNHE